MLNYDAEADRYDATRGGLARAQTAASAFAALLPPNAHRIADVGAGTGIVSAELARRGLDVVCIDRSAGMLRHAVARLPGSCLRAGGDRLPLRVASVDAVTFVWLLHLVPDAGPFLAEARRVLKPGGRIVTTVDKRGLGGATDSYDRVVAQSGLAPVAETTFVGVGQGCGGPDPVYRVVALG